MEQLILVDAEGNQIGTESKLDAHRNGGKLHLAFSILIYNKYSELLLQRRAAEKYHFAGLWSNACCGHPRPGESVVAAGERRLEEEFGFGVPLREHFRFQYTAHDHQSGYTECELVNVLVGQYDGVPSPDPGEIGDWRWHVPDKITEDMKNPDTPYTPWFRIIMQRLDSL